MKTKETLRQKAFRLWQEAGLPEFLNKYGPKITPGWMTFLAHLEHAEHAPNWRDTASFMDEYYQEERYLSTWHKAIQKWPQWVWDALAGASAGDGPVETAAIDGTTFSRSNPSQHFMKNVLGGKFSRQIQGVIMVNVDCRKFLSWRTRANPRGEKCDVPYLIRHSPVYLELVLMDKGFDSEPLHEWLRDEGIWSIAPTRK
ncbi:MAG: hypothetical protein ACE5FT_05290 [Candidatus Nanoarchaeia archaeon]